VKKLEAAITLEYDDTKTAEAIANAISPDNFKTPSGLTIKTQQRTIQVVTTIKMDGKMATFIATIDDLLFCTSTAEKTLHVLKRK
jgi:hypothetical protein